MCVRVYLLQVLDVGCGIGGGNFYMARDFGVDVLGIDLSQNMLAIAHERESDPENGERPSMLILPS